MHQKVILYKCSTKIAIFSQIDSKPTKLKGFFLEKLRLYKKQGKKVCKATAARCAHLFLFAGIAEKRCKQVTPWWSYSGELLTAPGRCKNESMRWCDQKETFLLDLIKNGPKLKTFWVCSTALICIEQQWADPQDSKVHTHPLKVRIFFCSFTQLIVFMPEQPAYITSSTLKHHCQRNMP